MRTVEELVQILNTNLKLKSIGINLRIYDISFWFTKRELQHILFLFDDRDNFQLKHQIILATLSALLIVNSTWIWNCSKL